MNSYTWILPLVFISVWNVNVYAQPTKFMVTEFGAVADGKTDNKEAFEKAWRNACQTPGGVVSVPAGNTFLLSGADFTGPCSGITRFLVGGTIVASDDPELDHLDYWITFDKVKDLTVIGGVFDGSGSSTWSRCGSHGDCDARPTSLRFHEVSGVAIRGITSKNSKMFHIQIHKAMYVKVSNVSIMAPADSPNTDGFHVSNSSNVQIVDSVIGTGDDCVSVGEGSRDVSILRVKCGPGHGFSIGSLGKYEDEGDVSGVKVANCSLTDTSNGLRIKTWAPSRSSTVVSGVTFAGIALTNVANPIVIDQYYCPNGGCQSEGESSVQISGVKYMNIRGSSATETGIDVECSETRPCEDVEFTQVDLDFEGEATTATCSNVDSRFQSSNPSTCS